jgi:hypothetical protein
MLGSVLFSAAMSTAEEEQEQAYLATLNDRERQAYAIAKDHLGMSFMLDKSNGFREWKRTVAVAAAVAGAAEADAKKPPASATSK